VETPNTRILIDAGFSTRRITQRLAEVGVAPEQIDGIILTHEHSDHSCGLDVWSRRFRTPVYANRLTGASLMAPAELLRRAAGYDAILRSC
jgi:glyoxylase-like metal-dependent hydrolase (beta-lactamase superfamily II)